MDEFNQQFGHKLVWIPWQRPGFELAMMLERAVKQVPGCDGVVLGGHGLFTWGNTQRESYLNTITIIDQIGQFIESHRSRKRQPFRLAGAKYKPHQQRQAIATKLMPFLRGSVSTQQRMIGSFTDIPEVLEFINSHSAAELAYLGTSCPDHFIRTKIRPLFVDWDQVGDAIADSGCCENCDGEISQRIRELLPEARTARLARDAPRQSNRRAGARYRHVQLRQEQGRGADHG